MANETVIHTSLFVRGAEDPNIPAQRFAVFTGTGATDTNLLGYRTASGIVSDLGLPEIIDDEVANLLSGGTNISLTYNDVANKLVISSTGSLAGSGTANQVAFWNATGVTGENDLWWNPSSNFLGIGTNSPSNSLHIESTGSTTSYLRTTSSSLFSAVQLANSSNNITSLQNYSPSATGTTAGLNNANLSVLNSTSSLALNTGSGSTIVSGIGGNQMMRVTSTGVIVGTGTTAARTLQVDGDFRLGSISGIMTNQILGRNSNNGDVGAMILGEGLALSMYTLSVTGTTFGTGTTNQIAYWATSSSITGENDLWWNPSTNSLGIGTNNPLDNVHINASQATFRISSSDSNNTTTHTIYNSSNDYLRSSVYGSTVAGSLYGVNLASKAVISGNSDIFLNPQGSLLVGNSTEYFRATSTGVGIGGVTPVRTLHVAGTMRLTGSTATIPTNILARNDDGDISNLVIGTGLNLSSGALSVSGATGTGVTNQVAFWANATTLSGETALWWNPSTDRLGIGTGAPAQTLDVAGTMRLTGSTGTSATIMGRNPSGDISAIVVDGGLSLSGNVLSATGVTYGTGTTNYLTKWASSSGLTNSIILETGNTIDINGALRVVNSSGTATTITGQDANGYVSRVSVGTGLSLSGNTIRTSGVTFGSGAVNQIAYWASASSVTGENDLWWDSSNNFLGIGTNSPSFNIDVLANRSILSLKSTGTTQITGGYFVNNDSSTSLESLVYGSAFVSSLYGVNLGSKAIIRSGSDLFISANGSIFVGNSSTEFFRATSTGIGIGGVTPARTLHVAGTMRLTGSTGTPFFILGRDSNGDISNVGLGAGLNLSSGTLAVSGATGTGVTNQVAFWANTTTLSGETALWWNPSTDRLGVGTSDPQQTLDVRGTMRLTGSTGTPDRILGRNSSGDVANLTIGSGLQLVSGTLSATGGASGTTSGTGSTNQVAFWTGTNALSGENNLWWDSSLDRLGVNTNNPQRTLHIEGDMRLTGSTGTPTFVMGRDNNGDIANLTLGSGLQLVGGQLSATGGSSGTTSGSGSTSQVAFWTGTNSLSGENELWWDFSTNRLGVGINTPSQTLDVQGTMRLTGSTGTSTTVMGRDASGDISAISIGDGLSLSGNVLSTTGITAGTVTGTGTTDYLSKWASASGLTDSIVLETGSTIDINGALRVRTSSGTSTTIAGQDNDGYFSNITVGNGLSLSGNILSTTGITAGTVTGTGTTNYLSKWASASGLTDSIVLETGSTIDINGALRVRTSSGTSTTIAGQDNDGYFSNITVGNGLSLSGNILTTTGITAGTVTGTGTTNYLSKWASASGLTDSIVFSSGSNVGINTNAPQQTLDVRGTMRLTGSTGTPTNIMGRDGSGDISNVTIGTGLQLVSGTLSATGGASGTTTGSGATSQVAFWVGANTLSGENNLWWDSSADKLGIGTSTPQRTLHVEGDMRLTGSTGTSTTVMGRDAIGDVSAITVGSGLSLSGNILSTTGNTFGTVTGTGTTNYLSKWASASGLTDSIVLETGSTIDINGSLRVRTSSGTSTTIAGQDGNGYFSRITVGSGLSLSGNTLSSTGTTGGGLTGSGTATQVAFWDGSTGTTSTALTSSSGLTWDNTNRRLGLGTLSPIARLYVKGVTNGSSSTVFEVTDNTDRDIINVRDDGRISLGRDLSVLTQSSVTIQAAGTETNIGIAIVPKGTGAITAHIPNGAVSGGDARGNNSIDWQMVRLSSNQVASGRSSVILGGENNRSSGILSISGGHSSLASGVMSVAIGGWPASGTHTASGEFSTTVGGFNSTASGYASTVIGGNSNTASAQGAIVTGGQNGLAYLSGQRSIASGRFAVTNGDAQTSDIRVRVLATGTSAAELTLDGGTPVASNRIVPALPTGAANGRLWNARVQLSAIVTVSGTSSGVAVGDSWVSEHIVGIKRIGSTTSLVGTGAIQNLISNDTSMSSAVVTISADDANESLKIEFTPPTTAVATTVIRVVATVYLTEVGF
jgi:hypothetical protein